MRHSFILLSSALLLDGCDAQLPLPSVTGKQGELVVVCDKKMWDSPAGDTVFSIFTADVYGLPQPEALFRTVHVAPESFTSIFRTHRNVLILTPTKDGKGRVEVRRDVWATPQMVVEAHYSDADGLIRLMQQAEQRVKAQLLHAEAERVKVSYSAQLEEGLMPVLADHRISMAVPKGYRLVKREADMCWMRYDSEKVNQSIIVFTENGTADTAMLPESLMASADRVGRKHVPGPDPETYMSIFREYPPMTTDTELGGQKAVRQVGLWSVEGAMMGGPFVHYAVKDTERGHTLHLFALVFAPAEEKRNLVLQVDALIQSLAWL